MLKWIALLVLLAGPAKSMTCGEYLTTAIPTDPGFSYGFDTEHGGPLVHVAGDLKTVLHRNKSVESLGKQFRTRSLDPGDSDAMRLSPDGKFIAVGTYDGGRVKVLEASVSPRVVHQFQFPASGVSQVAISANSEYVAGLDHNSLAIRRRSSGGRLMRFMDFEVSGYAEGIAFSPERQALAYTSRGGGVWLVYLSNKNNPLKEVFPEIIDENKAVSRTRFSSSGRYIINKTCRLRAKQDIPPENPLRDRLHCVRVYDRVEEAELLEFRTEADILRFAHIPGTTKLVITTAINSMEHWLPPEQRTPLDLDYVWDFESGETTVIRRSETFWLDSTVAFKFSTSLAITPNGLILRGDTQGDIRLLDFKTGARFSFNPRKPTEDRHIGWLKNIFLNEPGTAALLSYQDGRVLELDLAKLLTFESLE